MASEKPPDQPAPARETVLEASAERAVENDYFSIRQQQQQQRGKTVDDKLDSDDEADDPLYESISGAPGSVKSDTSPDVTPEPCSALCDQQLYESSDL